MSGRGAVGSLVGRFPHIGLGALMTVLFGLAGLQAATAKSTADRAWIERCVADRREATRTVAALRRYCACMQDIVDPNQQLGVTELERTYPPAHERCWAASKRPGRS